MRAREQHVNRRHDEQREDSADDHPAHEHDADAVPRARSWAGGEHQREVTGHGRRRLRGPRHRDGDSEVLGDDPQGDDREDNGAVEGRRAGVEGAEADPVVPDGDDVGEVLAGVIKEQPRWDHVPAALRRALVAQKELFVRTVTGKLLTYAVGREMEYFDAPAIRAIVRESRAQNFRVSSIMLGVVKSPQFQMRMSR